MFACFEHSNFFKVKDLDCSTHQMNGSTVIQKDDRRVPALTHQKQAGQARQVRNPTTSFLTATTLIYATGAGITAAAGTRLALQWIR